MQEMKPIGEGCEECDARDICPLKKHRDAAKGGELEICNSSASKDLCVEDVLQFIKMSGESLFNAIVVWQIDPPNDSTEGLAWRMRKETFLSLNDLQLSEVEDKIFMTLLTTIAAAIKNAVDGVCKADMCEHCAITSHCPLERELHKKR